MSSGRLVRSGTVSRVSHGCALVRVSVPCTSCSAGVCQMRSPAAAGSIEIRDIGDKTITEGEAVALSVSASALTRASVCVFGPMIGWAVCYAVLAPAGLAAAILGMGGVVLAAGLGRSLAIRAADRLGVELLAPNKLSES